MDLPETYADLMKIHSKGHGFYHPEDSRDVRPGACGYIDKSGQWRPIVNVTDAVALSKGGYKPLTHNLIKARSDEFLWEAVHSEGVISNKSSITIAADASGAGAPVEGTVTFSLEKSVKAGAVLLCNSTVHRKGFAHEKPLRDWGKANASVILKNYGEDVERYGFWVVSTTFAISDVWTNVWKNSQKSVSIGVTARSVGIGELSPKLEWSNAKSGGGWIHPIPTVTNGELDKRVVFFCGVRFKLYELPFGAYAREVRGEESPFIITNPDDADKPENQRMRYEVEVSIEGEKEEEEDNEEEQEDDAKG